MMMMLIILLGSFSTAQSKETWKEYSYPEDGFAITLPTPPNTHPDRNIPNATAYSVSLTPDFAFTLRVVRESRDCSLVLGKLRTANPSVKDVTIDGHPGVEYESDVSTERVVRLRYYCLNGRTYILAVNRERNSLLLPAAAKIINSFRLVTTTERKSPS